MLVFNQTVIRNMELVETYKYLGIEEVKVITRKR
jgi:hypothetical protein